MLGVIAHPDEQPPLLIVKRSENFGFQAISETVSHRRLELIARLNFNGHVVRLATIVQ
jgi:hypothetical protein